MNHKHDLVLDDETAAWCERAAAAMGHPGGPWQPLTALIRAGVALRRRWDRVDPFASARGPLIESLAALQTIAHRQLSAATDEDGEPPAGLVQCVLDELADDDGYLAGLLEDQTLSDERIAFAIECFRDDLHWLGTQVALLDGAQGIDFLGRILLEQEALQREIDIWEDQLATAADGAPSRAKAARDAERTDAASAAQSTGRRPRGSQKRVAPLPEQLRRAADNLRVTALTRRAEALIAQPAATDWRGWQRQWRAASHVAMQIDPPSSDLAAGRSTGTSARQHLDPQLVARLDAFRNRAAKLWAECLAGMPPEGRRAAIERVAADLCDLASETLSFLEDLPLERAVRGLEILSDDLRRCREAVGRHWSRDLRGVWRSLRRQRARVEEELQERRLAWRLESIFGHRAVMLWERLILILLVLFLGMLTAEITMVEELDLHSTEVELTVIILAWADLGICAVFLTDFLVRLYLAQRRWLYFWHNWITGLVPSIPFGFISLYAVHLVQMAEAGEGFVFLRALRYLRLPRMARWLRLARPLVRMFRLLGFALRASDRLMRQLGPVVNRNLVLFGQADIEAEQPKYRRKISALRERFNYRAAEVFTALPETAQWRLLEARIGDLTAMLRSSPSSLIAPAPGEESHAGREIPLDRVVSRLLVATPAGISDRIGRRLARSVARWCQAFDLFAIRRLPVIRDLVAAGRLGSPYETTARVANRIGRLLKGWMDRIYWIADLYGTVTAPQLVDSIGEYMVRGTARPARRLITIGAAFLAVWYLTSLLPFETLSVLTLKLRRLIGAPLVILGILCLVPLFLGMWFRRIAGEATDFYNRVAEAQFLSATKQLKAGLAGHQHAEFQRRVIAPEGQLAEASEADIEEVRRAVDLLWTDYLDGSPFHRSDTKTTTQLLGNLALVSLRYTRLAYGRRERKRLARLDLANTRTSLRGPYLWFMFISRSLAQQTAKLVVDYNANALPLARLESADDELAARYICWLAKRLGKPIDQVPLPPALEGRFDVDSLLGTDISNRQQRLRREGFPSSDFTAIHFLSNDPAIEEDICRRYGHEVAALVRADRRDNIRHVFRTYPLYRLPKEARTINPMTLYERHLSGGRVLLFPLKLIFWTLRLTARATGLVWRVVREVLHPTMGTAGTRVKPDPYAVALRKIHRMRGPVFMECLTMRAQFDPEYLGILLPGSSAAARGARQAPVEADLRRIAADPSEYQRIRELAARRRLQVLQLRRWLARFELGELPARSMRAVAIAYVLDYHGLRGKLEATAELKRAFDDILTGPPPRRCWSPRAVACRLRHGRRVKTLLAQPEFAGYDSKQRQTCRRLICERRGKLLEAVRRLTASGAADPVQRAGQMLASVARDPAAWNRQLVTLRAVQTLSVLDLETYCQLVAELGEYDTSTSDAADGMLPDRS